MTAFHQHGAAAHRRERIPLLFHFALILRVRRIQQRSGFRQIRRDKRNLRQQLISQRLDGGGGQQRVTAFASITVSSTTFCTGNV